MEIKVGDKVRVRKDAPKLYTCWYECDFLHCDSTVKCVESDSAEIERSVGDNGNLYYLSIPTKYLIKVDDEAKEPKLKVGDNVKVCKIGDALNGAIGEIIDISNHGACYVLFPHAQAWFRFYDLESYTEPTEEVNLQDATVSELRDLANHGVSVGDEVKRRIKEREEKPNVGKITIPVEADLTDSFWDSYTAELAKEIAVKLAGRDVRPPKELGEYAVKVAKAVVEGLRKGGEK